MSKEAKFYEALQDVFVGAKIEGEGGFIRLMKIKSSYYSQIEKLLQQDINKALENHPNFRDDLFDKLYSFFNRYFTKNGSIYFNSTPFHNNIYERVYTDEKDVILFWKTQMLYYVKTDKIFRSMPVEIDTLKFYFDASQIESKKSNEKRNPSYEIDKIRKDNTVVFSVSYSNKETISNVKKEEILKALKEKNIIITEEQLEKAFRLFEKQSEVDFFINKNAKSFLEEQFMLWSYQYLWDSANEWNVNRVKELQILKNIAFKIILFISQFEDELVKIWNKPKFVRNSNYVITIDKIKDENLFEKLIKAEGMTEQIKEWQELGFVDKKFKLSYIFEDKKYSNLPLDTKYFKEFELKILALFEDLDNQLDGRLIQSENYQALNTLLPKFKGRVQTIYIDPPFNTGEDFPYVDKFQDASWLSLMYDRINLSKDFLRKEGNFYYHIDRYAYYYSRLILNRIYGDENFKAEIAWDTCGITGFKPGKDNWVNNINYILHFAKNNDENFFAKLFIILDKEEREKLNLGWLDLLYDEKTEKYYAEIWDNNKLMRKNIDTEVKKHPVGMVWGDPPSGIYSFLFTQVANNESFFFKTQKPEHLLRRIIQSSTSERDIVMDYFSGIGTTIASAHKLNRRWIGIEMGNHFNTFYEYGGEKKIGALGRLKIVLFGDQTFSIFGHPRHPQLSRNINWPGGGFFKYYSLEQYDETLKNCKYCDGNLFDIKSEKAYQEYVFMKDEKMLSAIDIDYKNDKVKVDLTKIYPDIDIAETLSNLTGKWIKKISAEEVEFVDGTKVNIKNMDYKIIKSLIWW